MRTRSMNKGIAPFEWYNIELNKRLDAFSNYSSYISNNANNCWNYRGDKKLKFIELLLNFIYIKWDDIFDSDSKLWAIKTNVISDVTCFLDSNIHLTE